MKKKRLGYLALGLVAAILFTGCGTDKNLEPVSELVLQGADPPSLNIGVDPPLNHQTYFVFRIKLSEKSLSLVPADAWTIDSYDISYTLQSDPGRHLAALPTSEHKNTHTKVTPGVQLRLPVTIVTDTYLRDYAQGFVGTSDTAIVKAHLVFHAHRNKDGVRQSFPSRFLFTLGNF
jgi:hypothetical protein